MTEAGRSNVREGPRAKECRQLLETEKGREMDFSPERFRRNRIVDALILVF